MPASSTRHDGEDQSGQIQSYWVHGHLVAFNFGQVDIVAINDPFDDLCYMVFMFYYDSTYNKFYDTAKPGKKTYNQGRLSPPSSSG
ncbi:hypothetical protein STEG23_013600 [Scotinomys teguina]